mgnify:CR=1 FL=1
MNLMHAFQLDDFKDPAVDAWEISSETLVGIYEAL